MNTKQPTQWYQTTNEQGKTIFVPKPSAPLQTLDRDDLVKVYANMGSGEYQSRMLPLSLILDSISEISGEIPTKVSELQNDAGYITEAEIDEDDPVFKASPAYHVSNSDIVKLANTSGVNTGDQTLPTSVSDLTNDIGFITSGQVPSETDPIFTSSEAFNINAQDIVNLGNLSGTNTGDQYIPSGLSEFDNDVGYITSGEVTTYETDTLQTVTDRSNITTNSIEVSGIQTPYVQFDIEAAPIANAEGLLQWNETDGTLDLGMSGGDVTMQIGQEMFIKVRNQTGATITNGSVVYFSGRSGNRPLISLAKADAHSTSCVAGVATQDISSPSDGFITTMGYVRGIKTNYTGTGIWGTTWEEGDKLYVSKTDSGVLTNVEPSVPHHSDIVGTVGIIHGTIGSILIDIQKTIRLEQLADVDGTPLTTDGQIPIWNNTEGYFDFDKNINDYLPTTHLTDFTHEDIAHANRASLDLVSGTNTGDQDLSGYAKLDGTNQPFTGAIKVGDNVKHFFGTGDDASITYNGTNLVINPREVGAGNTIFSTGDVGIGTTDLISPLTILNNNQQSVNAPETSGLTIVNTELATSTTRKFSGIYLKSSGWNPSTGTEQESSAYMFIDPQINNNPTFYIKTKRGASINTILSIDYSGFFYTPFRKNNYRPGAVANEGVWLVAGGAALSTAPNQFSPYIKSQGRVWDTTTSSSKEAVFITYVTTYSGVNPSFSYDWFGGFSTDPTTKLLSLMNNGDLKLVNDNQNLYFGAGDDASITYDGTNLVINPKVVGSGILDVQGNIQATNLSGTNTGDQDLKTSQFASVGVNTTLDDTHEVIEVTQNVTITLPTAIGIVGRKYTIKNTSGTYVTIDGNGTETIDGYLSITSSNGESYTLISNGTNWLVI